MKKNGFTLAEVLVALSIAAIIAAVLMPALTFSRRQGKSIICLSRLRQLGVAAQVYVNDNDGFYPPAYIKDSNPHDSIAVHAYWDFIEEKNWDTGERVIKPGLLWQGQTNAEVQQCPSFKGQANSSDPYTGYNYNTSFVGHGSGEPIETPARADRIRKPGKCAIFGDGEYCDGANKFMRSPFTSDYDNSKSTRVAGTQGYRHCGKTNVAWADGSVSSWNEIYTLTTKSSDTKRLEAHNKTAKVKIGFLSPDNSLYDLK